MDPEYRKIPQHIRDSLLRYLQFGCYPGSFVTGVLTNDLRGALGNADKESLEALKPIWLFAMNVMPGMATGSRDDVDRWLRDENLRMESMDSLAGEEAIAILSTPAAPSPEEQPTAA